MKNDAHRMALCGVLAALCVALMALGSTFGVLTYACPMLAGAVVLFLQQAYGVRYALAFWGAVSLLGLLLVPDLEMAVLFLSLFGWYPVAKPRLDCLPTVGRRMTKMVLFNGAVLLAYTGLALLLGVDALALGGWLETGLLLLAGNGLFWLYDRMLDKLSRTLFSRVRRLLPRD